MTSIPFARIPWVHTNARVMLGTQEMENIAMVFEIQLIHNKLFFKETTYSDLKVLKQDDETIEGAMVVCKSSTLSCHFGGKAQNHIC